jgi:TRAP-type C4-dicarboxylate transport system substrate-binding protein
MKISLKGGSMFVALIIAVIFVMSSSSFAGAAQYRLGAHYQAGYFCNNGFRRVAERIKKATNGKVDIVLYESGALGSYEQVFQEVIRGTIDMTTNYVSSRFNKKLEIVGTPSMASGFEELEKLLRRESPFHKYMESVYDECGVVFIGSFVDTIVGVSVRGGKTIEHPFDTSNKQFQLRVVPVPVARKWWSSMGFQLANVPWAEIFTSLQTGVIDGDSGTGPEGAFLGWGEIIKTYIEYPVFFYTLDLCVSKKAWGSFDDKTKQIVIDAFDAERESVYKEAKASYDYYLQKMKDAGIIIISPTADELKFMDEVSFKYAWPEIEKIVGPELLPAIKEYLGK